MSKFSEKLKLHIEDSEVKIYQLAKKSELDRTTIQRAISGERLPSLDFVEKLIDCLRLSPIERTELLDLYSFSKIGEKVYNGRKYIKELIEGIATIHYVSENVPTIEKGISFTKNINKEDTVYEGQYIINNMIRAILEEEVSNNPSPEISISVPISSNFIFDIINQLYLGENGNINIKSLTRFNKTNAYQDSNFNLEILSHVIPFAFSAGNGFQLYYYYDNFDSSSDIAAIMPYYIITSKQLITLSADNNSAILYNNEDIVNIYKFNFDSAIKESTPLIKSHNTCNDIIQAYFETFKSTGTISHVIEPQPCFAWYYTDDLINKHLRPEIEDREIIYVMLCDYYKKNINCNNKPLSVFSVEGLSIFAATGILADLPTQYAIPFTVEERIMLLDSLKNDMLSGEYQVYAVNSSKFIIPFITIQLSTTYGITFYTTNNNGIISMAFIEEESIAEAFFDFFTNLPKSNLLYSIDESISIIDGFIEQCRNIKS